MDQKGRSIMLRGNQRTRIDDKGRLKIPASFRTEIEDSWGSDFYVTSVTGQSVLIYPLPVWQEIEEKLAILPALNPTKKKFLDRTNYYGQVSSMDKQGRILIGSLLRESADMTGEVAVLGYLNYLDVWNNDRFRKQLDDEPYTHEDQQVISELVS
jgi:MraZ protein